MSLTTDRLPRVFEYDSKKLADPNPDMTIDEVRKFYTRLYPELNNSNFVGPLIEDGKAKFSISKNTGTKG